MSAFITKVNNPKVRSVAGRVRIIRMGFISVFTIPNPTDAIIAVKNESTATPGIT
jgi:hypothetical protein